MILDCDQCQARVDGKVLTYYDVFDEEEMIPYRYSFVRCPSCDLPMVALQDSFQTDQNKLPLWETPTRLHPATERPLSRKLPDSVRQAYEEARKCFRAKAFTGAAILCRKCLEAISHEHGVKKSNLASGLEELKNQGVIENRLFEWAQALRIAGNAAAHDVGSSVTAQDAQDLVEFTDALIQYVFTFRDRFDEFMARRQAAAKPKTKATKKIVPSKAT
jgi:hypothetical protein